MILGYARNRIVRTMVNLGLTAEQKTARRLGVGGSDAGKIMSGAWNALWREKTGRAEPKKIMSEWDRALRAVTETLQLDWFTHETGRLVTHRGEAMVSEQYPIMRCTLDGLIEDVGEPINAKHVSYWTKQPIEWCVEHYAWQMIHEAVVCGADRGWLSIIHGEKQPEVHEIPLDPFAAEALIAKEHEFWGYVERDEEPVDQDGTGAPKVEIKRLRIIQLEDEFRDNWPNWGAEFADQVRVFNTTKPAADLHAITREKMKALLPEDVGEVRRGHFKCARDKAGSIRLSLSKEKTDASP